MSKLVLSLKNAIVGSIQGLAIGDSLSMPVHWYYDPTAITRDFGLIADFRPPAARHPSSIMNLSNTGGAGRGGRVGVDWMPLRAR